MHEQERARLTDSPTRGEIENLIKRTIVKILDLKVEPEEIGSTEPLIDDGVGLNSVAMIEIVVATEEHLNVTIPDDDLSRNILSSVQAFADYLHRLLQRSGGEEDSGPADE